MRSQSITRLCGLIASAMAVVILAGCSGNNGATGAAGPAGPQGPTGPQGPGATTVVNLNQLSSSEWAALNLQAQITNVTVSAAQPQPVVDFTVTDAQGHGVTGFGGFTAQAVTTPETLPSYPNLGFALAKLVPEDTTPTSVAASKWVSYMVTSVPKVGQAPTAGRPGTENQGTLVDNGDGTYRYTFRHSIPQVATDLAATTDTSTNKKADLGDVSFQPSLTHRLTLAIYGWARGTGKNTPTGAQGATDVTLANPVNVAYDFVPATGTKLTAATSGREISSTAACNSCHGKLGTAFHNSVARGGLNRMEMQYCAVCHTDQRKFGYANSTLSGNAYSGDTRKINDHAVADMTPFIHRLHMGKELTHTGYDYDGVLFNEKGYSMLDGGQKMCSKCHVDSPATPQAANWNLKPSRIACGSCHDGVDFATGAGHSVSNLAQANDNACTICHDPDTIKTYHLTENVTPNNPTVRTGLVNFAYEIASAAVNDTTGDVTVTFKITADGTPITFLPAAAGMANPLTGFTGAPGFLLSYAVDQDGVTSPIDYNNAGVAQAQAISVSIANLLNTTMATTVGTLAAGSNGYYVATILGSVNGGTKAFPIGSKLRAVGLQGYFTQLAATNSIGANTARHAKSVVKAVTGDTARRTVVDSAKCAQCHEFFEGHGGNRNYEVAICTQCHVPGLATSGRSATVAIINGQSAATNAILAGWGYTLPVSDVNTALTFPVTSNNLKDMIHGIHAGADRTTPFLDARVRSSTLTLIDVSKMEYPNILKNCETCHIAGTYSGVPDKVLASTYEHRDASYPSVANTVAAATTALAQTTAQAEDLVTTPFTAACVSCHDNNPAKAHMSLNGGQILVNRSALNIAGESCAVCHGAGADFDPVKLHQ